VLPLQLNSYHYTAFMEEAARRQSMAHIQDYRRLTRDDSFMSSAGAFHSSGVISSSSGCSSWGWRGCWGSETYVTPAWWSLLVSPCSPLPSFRVCFCVLPGHKLSDRIIL
jgi:hypothetical protein